MPDNGEHSDIYNVRERAKWTDVAGVVLTLALFLCGVAAVVVSRWQWKATQDQIQLTRDLANSSTADTKATLKISDRIAVANERESAALSSALVINRRGISISEASLQQSILSRISLTASELSHFEVGGKPMVDAIVRNSRGADINNVYASGMIKIMPRNDNIGLTHKIPKKVGEYSINTIAEGNTGRFNMETDEPLSQAVISRIISGDDVIYVVVDVDYIDPLGKHTKHLCVAYYGEWIPNGHSCKAKADS